MRETSSDGLVEVYDIHFVVPGVFVMSDGGGVVGDATGSVFLR